LPLLVLNTFVTSVFRFGFQDLGHNQELPLREGKSELSGIKHYKASIFRRIGNLSDQVNS
jgi:hypothetical protein